MCCYLLVCIQNIGRYKIVLTVFVGLGGTLCSGNLGDGKGIGRRKNFSSKNTQKYICIDTYAHKYMYIYTYVMLAL